MELKEAITTRRSVRSFTQEPVSQQVLEAVVSAAAYAPSWKNTQTTRYIVVTSEDVRHSLAAQCMCGHASNAEIVKGAPMVILVTTLTGRSGFERDGTPTTSKGAHWESFDAGIATQTLCLAAHGEGLGSVVLGIFDEAAVGKVVKIPQGQSLSAMVAIGYAAQVPDPPKRKSVEELLQMAE